VMLLLFVGVGGGGQIRRINFASVSAEQALSARSLSAMEIVGFCFCMPEAVDMNGRFQMQGGKNWILPKKVNANRFFWDSHWLAIWSNHFCPSMGLNGGSVATDSE
jgi:hypothetical protein